jgi:hypothetical protein
VDLELQAADQGNDDNPSPVTDDDDSAWDNHDSAT